LRITPQKFSPTNLGVLCRVIKLCFRFNTFQVIES
jgi:hypothetical protein